MAKILVIDDDPLVRAAVSRLLENAGFAVSTAEDGRRGLQLFHAERPDLTITDLIMPVREGIETIRDMRQARADAKIIAMSGSGRIGNADLLQMAFELGATDVMTKPFEPEDLLRRVVDCIKGR